MNLLIDLEANRAVSTWRGAVLVSFKAERVERPLSSDIATAYPIPPKNETDTRILLYIRFPFRFGVSEGGKSESRAYITARRTRGGGMGGVQERTSRTAWYFVLGVMRVVVAKLRNDSFRLFVPCKPFLRRYSACGCLAWRRRGWPSIALIWFPSLRVRHCYGVARHRVGLVGNGFKGY